MKKTAGSIVKELNRPRLHRNRLIVGLTMAGLLVGANLAVQAADFNPVADSYTEESSSGSNNETSSRLRIQSSASGDGQIAFLKFNVSGLSGSVTAATLQMYANTGTGDPATAYAVSDNSWTENGITWDNQPALGSALDTINVADGVYNNFDVSGLVTGDGTYSIAIQCDTDVKQSLRSREHDSLPILTVHTVGGESAFSVGTSPYPTEDRIVYLESAATNGVINDGSVDVTADIQAMIDSVNAAGGGTVFLEEGTYRIDGNLVIKPAVTLRGVWEEPTAGQPINGTVLAIYGGRGSTTKVPTITVGSCATVKEMVFWHPEQTADNITPYPPTVGAYRWNAGGMPRCSNFERLTFVNSYTAIVNESEDPDRSAAHFMIKNVHGTPLYKGVDFDSCTGNPKFTGLFFGPDYWKGSGFPGSPTGTAHEAYMAANGMGMDIHTSGQTYIQFGTISGMKYGVYHTKGDTSIYGMDFLNCAESGFEMLNGNMRAVDCTLDGADYGLNSTDVSTEQVYHSCEVSGSTAAIHAGSGGFIGVQDCVLSDKVVVTNGVLSLVDNDFAFSGRHVDILSSTIGATIFGNTFGGAFDYSDSSTNANVKIDHGPVSYTDIPSYTWADFNSHVQDFKPGTNQLFDVTTYGAVGDATTDDTQAFQDALDAASAAGGGIVMVPGGWYNIPGTLTIPSDVELRGVHEGAHDTSEDNTASILFVSNGQGSYSGTAFITMQANSGMRGLSFFYPNQVLPPLAYPFLIRGAGANIYIDDLSAGNVSQFLDIASNDCDNFYAENAFHNILDLGYKIGGGSSNVRINTGQGKGFWTYMPNTLLNNYYDPDGTILNAYTSDNLVQIEAGDVTDLVLMACFTRENNFYVKTIDEGGQSPNGFMTVNNGGEGTVRGYDVAALESDLHIINSQFKVNRCSEFDPIKYQFHLDYTGDSKVVAAATVMDSKAEMEGYLHDGQLELQCGRFDQQITQSGFIVDAGASLKMSCSYSPENCATLANGSVEYIGNYFHEMGIAATPNSLYYDIYDKNIVAGKGRSVQANLYGTVEAIGMDVLDTADSDNVAVTLADDWDGANKTLNFTVRKPVPVDGANASRMYFDITNSDMIGQGMDCTFYYTWYVEPGSTGDVLFYYDGPNGQKRFKSRTVDTVTQGEFTDRDHGMNGCEFLNRINGGDIMIEVPDSATVYFLNAVVQENAIHADLSANDGDPPAPNPAGFASAPYADSSTAISMIATTATDASGTVEYLFTETRGGPGASSSGWQSSTSYTDRGLSPDTQYSYTVTYRDGFGNTGSPSAAVRAYTYPKGPEIANAGFEAPVQSGGKQAYTVRPTGAIWMFTGPAGIQRNGSAWNAENAPEGQQTLFLKNVSSITQPISIDAGEYEVIFSMARRRNYQLQTVEVLFDGLLLGTYKTTNPYFNEKKIAPFTVPSSGTYVLEFRGLGKTDENGDPLDVSAFIDDIRIQSTEPPIVLSFDQWAQHYGGFAVIGSSTNDYDGDGQVNLAEYALGGNPTNRLDYGEDPTMDTADGGMRYVHPQRSDDSELTYAVEVSTNLMVESWTRDGVTAISTNVTGEVLNVVTNQVPDAEPKLYIRLKVGRE